MQIYILKYLFLSTCEYGQWNCTEEICTKECSVLGFNHIKTFDGAEYTNWGPESGDAGHYTLVNVSCCIFFISS